MNEAKTLVIRGNLVDIINRRTFGAEISILNGHIGKVIPSLAYSYSRASKLSHGVYVRPSPSISYNVMYGCIK